MYTRSDPASDKRRCAQQLLSCVVCRKKLVLSPEQIEAATRIVGCLKFLTMVNTNRYRVAQLGAARCLISLYEECANTLLRRNAQVGACKLCPRLSPPLQPPPPPFSAIMHASVVRKSIYMQWRCLHYCAWPAFKLFFLLEVS